MLIAGCSGDGTVGPTSTKVIPPAPTASLKSSASSVFPDQPFTVTWSSNQSSCFGNWTSWTGTAPSGSQPVMSNSPGTDSLMITCGTAIANASVTINAMPSSVPTPDLTANASVVSLTNGTDNGTWAITDSGTAGTFLGSAAMYSTHTLTIDGNTDVVNQYYSENPYTPVGSIDTTTNITGVYSNYTALPASLTNGTNGTLYQISYQDSMGNVIGAGTLQWQFFSNNACSYQLALTEDDTINNVSISQEWNFGVLWNGSISLISYQLQQNGTSVYGQLSSTWGC